VSTKERYGTIVWEAVIAYEKYARKEGISRWFTVTDIAVAGEVSQPTARKYLSILVDEGHVWRAGTKRMPVYMMADSIFRGGDLSR